jgi:hypothetical protein
MNKTFLTNLLFSTNILNIYYYCISLKKMLSKNISKSNLEDIFSIININIHSKNSLIGSKKTLGLRNINSIWERQSLLRKLSFKNCYLWDKDNKILVRMQTKEWKLKKKLIILTKTKIMIIIKTMPLKNFIEMIKNIFQKIISNKNMMMIIDIWGKVILEITITKVEVKGMMVQEIASDAEEKDIW